MPTTHRALVGIWVAAIAAAAPLFAQTAQTQPQSPTRLVPVEPDPAIAANATVAPVNSSPGSSAPHINSGPAQMLPTDLILLRRVIATFGDQYHQEIELTLPIFYDSGYLNLNEHDKAELVRLNQEFKGLMAEYESFTSRFSDFMNRYNELHKRGRPPGVIRDSELLVPYSGMPNDKIGNLGPIRVIKQQTESIEPRAATAPVSPITVEPKK